MPAQPETYTLYSTSACHLCELAHALVVEYGQAFGAVALEEVDIANDDALFERYGLTIPVLRAPSGAELNWPFDAEQLRAFIQA